MWAQTQGGMLTGSLLHWDKHPSLLQSQNDLGVSAEQVIIELGTHCLLQCRVCDQPPKARDTKHSELAMISTGVSGHLGFF